MNSSFPFGLLGRYLWIGFIAATVANGVSWWYRAQPHIRRDPTLEPGYRTLIRNWMILFNLPWVVMGAGILFGGVPGVFHYFNVRNGPWVVAWLASVVLVWIVCGSWIFFRGGAEQLVRHPGLLNVDAGAGMIRIFTLLGLAGGIVALGFIVFADLRVP